MTHKKNYFPYLVNSPLGKIQFHTTLAIIITFLSIKYSNAQTNQTIYFKAYQDLSEISARSTNSLKEVLNQIEYNSLTQPIKSRVAKNVDVSPFLKEASKIYRLDYSKGEFTEIKKALLSTGLIEHVELQPTFYPQLIPNDPLSQESTNGSPQIWAHDFPSAWDITTGDTNIIIGFVDSGIRFDHEDLKANLFYNLADPINGVNDDGDYYFDSSMVDNYTGWDFGDWDNDPSTPSSFDHGLVVTSMAMATPNNDTGIVGTGYNCRYMPVKISKDATPTAFQFGYDGMLYSALSGCHVINLSWGAPNAYSPILQDYINYIVNDLNIVIVAAAGNSSIEEYYYPATYQNVISVTGVKSDSLKQANSTYNYFVDVNVVDVIPKTARYNGSNYYGFEQGTSVASSIVAGAIGLVRAHRPALKAYQIETLLRATGFKNDTMNDPLYKEKIGYFLDPVKALADTSTSGIRMNVYTAYNNNGFISNQGDTLNLELDLVNYLADANNAKITLQAVSDNLEIIDSTFDISYLASLDTTNNYSTPFKIYVKPSTNSSEHIVLRLDIADTTRNDYEYIEFDIPITVITATTPEGFNVVRPTPNPSEGMFSFDLPEPSIVTIVDIEGRTLFSQSNKEGAQNIDLSMYPNGMYYLSVKSAKRTEVHKLILK